MEVQRASGEGIVPDTAVVLLSKLVSLFQSYQTLLGLMKLSHHPHLLLLLHLLNQCRRLSQSLLLSRYNFTGMCPLSPKDKTTLLRQFAAVHFTNVSSRLLSRPALLQVVQNGHSLSSHLKREFSHKVSSQECGQSQSWELFCFSFPPALGQLCHPTPVDIVQSEVLQQSV